MKKKPLNADIDLFFDYNIDIKNRILYFGKSNQEQTEVNDNNTELLIKGLSILDGINHKRITIIWSSEGGSWDAGMGCYEFIRLLKSSVRMISYSRCSSMGTIILQACKERILTKNSSFLIHYGSLGTGELHSKDFERAGQQSFKINNLMEDIYLKKIKEKHPKYTKERLQELMKYDCYMTADEAVHIGLADKVI